jgi:hypothetical protein
MCLVSSRFAREAHGGKRSGKATKAAGVGPPPSRTLTGPASPRRSVCAPGVDRFIVSQTVHQMETLIMAFLFSRRSRNRRPVCPRRSFVPRLESLEDRTVLSTLTVLNNLDSGAGSLRNTIAHANSGDTIVFGPSLAGQTINLTSGELALNQNLDIEGPGASLLAISGNDTYRVFDINQGLTVTIAGLTITHGQTEASRPDGGGSGGGGIHNAGTLTLADDVLSSNQSDTHGGAISNAPAAVLSVTNSIFTGNQAIAKPQFDHVEGGAIWNSGSNGSGGGATATVMGSTFIDNRAIGGSGGTGNFIGIAIGGAIHNDGQSTMTVQNSTFIGNQAIGGNGNSAGKNATAYFLGVAGGGAITGDEGKLLVVSGCTFLDNQAIGGSNETGNSSGFAYIGTGRGGALFTDGSARVTNSTFVGNEAVGGNGNTGGGSALLVGVGDGGAIARDPFGGTSQPLTVSNCTFTNNQAVGGAGNRAGVFVGNGMGGAFENFAGATATVTGSTFSGNQALGGNGATGSNAGDALGGALSNLTGSTLTVSGCTLTGNQAVGGAGGAGANGGKGFGGGIFNDGLSVSPVNVGTPATLMVTGSTITGNQASGGAAGAGGTAGQGIGGGVYLVSGGVVCFDLFTSLNLVANTATSSNNNVFGTFTICP